MIGVGQVGHKPCEPGPQSPDRTCGLPSWQQNERGEQLQTATTKLRKIPRLERGIEPVEQLFLRDFAELFVPSITPASY